MDVWGSIKADREIFADFLSTLTPDDWSVTSRCAGWTVKAVVAHLLVAPTMSKGKIFLAFASSGFNLDKMSAKLVEHMTTAMSVDEMAAKVRSTAGSQSAPPGLKPVGVLSEILIHASDISEPVNKPLDFPVEHYVAALDHLKNVQPIFGVKKRIAGLELKATDTSWSTGSGPLVEGSAKNLLAAMTGRRAAITALTGPGVEALRSR